MPQIKFISVNPLQNSRVGVGLSSIVGPTGLQGPTGSSSLWLSTGSIIYYNSGNIGIGTNNPQYLLEVNGNISPYVVNRGNPGSGSALTLQSYNTVHYYTASSVSFIDISTTMLENAVYEIKFNMYGGSTSNNDMRLYPNYNLSFGSTVFYLVYTQSPSTPGIQYTTANSDSFYFDFVSGSIGWDPVGTITIYNIRNAKKITVVTGDTTAIVQGSGYWTSGSGFSSTSVTGIVYDTSTQWSNIGRLTFGSQTFSGINVWVKRIA